MNRRTFLATLPAAAIAAPAFAEATVPPARWTAGADRFERPDLRGGDRPVGASFASRTAAYGLSGAAGTAHPLATLAGIEILRKGGSAVDAAITINACLGFLEPTSCGIGGDCYAMLWDPKVGAVMGLAGSGASPRGLDLETVRSRAKNGALPPLGAITVSVPGTVDAWGMLHARYGKLKWAELFEPAIDLAERGAPVPDIIAYYIRRALVNFRKPGAGIEEIDNALRTYAIGGEGPKAGGVFRNPDLARTYRIIAQGGRDAFYEGEIAKTIDAYFRRIGGWLRREDLAAHRGEWITPCKTDYRGVGVHALGANTQGIATLQMLNILEHFDLEAAGFQSPLSIHLQVEAKRLAYEDRARYYADPHAAKVPVDWLISKDYAAQRARLINPNGIMRGIRPGQAPSQGDTTYFTCADKDGMMVSMIQSNFRGMGSGLVADGLGFMFQDRGQLFALRDGHPNIYAPGKRPFQTIIPGFATIGDQPWMSFGVMGGDMQPQGQVQIVVNRRDYGLEIQAAGDSPRWHHEGSSQAMGEDAPDLPVTGLLRLESGVPEKTRTALAAMGWTIGASDGGFGRYECIERRTDGPDRVYAAASEMRADGCALAY
ncbi:gamma-glutamyltransferase [Sphingomonas histidinilytica]|uniref:Gamma-glutamyltranspeptidase / glutathione hydrolase n=1 Tax=Rhizorhabdus histidinilytica TaxID=439228 RepID=A0A1T5CSB2_9SPHN|nr:gamma-glutamyltransferase family protein [Rhizorhabdus histidinilytica]MBO9379074.1 gamma-glutamyltransferase [Rhizorhabdus histidinilytica]SKB62211.1 gamma-glutamyltranspeptidase / glutathione hydrolase [Rhizorhabdus histidinilytica]